MVRFIVTADWQLGMHFKQMPRDRADKARDARLKSIERMVEHAVTREVDFVVVAGDAFDGNDVPRSLITSVVNILEGLVDIPVYFLPGNHDHDGPASIYRHFAWEGAGVDITILSERKVYETQGAYLVPTPLSTPTELSDPTVWMDDIQESYTENLPRIGIAHGALDIMSHVQMDIPISADRASKADIDVLCLGHWHSFLQHESKTFYSGTPEQTKFGESESGTVSLVEVERGGTPTITRLPTGYLKWDSLEQEVSDDSDLNDIVSQIRDYDDPGNRLVKLKVSGTVSAETYSKIPFIESQLTERFLHASIKMDKLTIEPDEEGIVDIAPEGAIREVIGELIAESEQSVDSREAVSLFYRLARGD